MEDTQVQNQQNDSSKDKKKFQDGFARMMSMLNGDTSLFKSKVQGAKVPGLIERLTSKRREAAEQEFIEKASALLDKKVAFDRDVAKKKQEFEKAIADKEKEFLTEMNNVFALIDNFNDIQKSYASVIGQLSGTEPEPNTGAE